MSPVRERYEMLQFSENFTLSDVTNASESVKLNWVLVCVFWHEEVRERKFPHDLSRKTHTNNWENANTEQQCQSGTNTRHVPPSRATLDPSSSIKDKKTGPHVKIEISQTKKRRETTAFKTSRTTRETIVAVGTNLVVNERRRRKEEEEEGGSRNARNDGIQFLAGGERGARWLVELRRNDISIDRVVASRAVTVWDPQGLLTRNELTVFQRTEASCLELNHGVKYIILNI